MRDGWLIWQQELGMINSNSLMGMMDFWSFTDQSLLIRVYWSAFTDQGLLISVYISIKYPIELLIKAVC